MKTISGIYKITNIENNKFYVGSSCNIKQRWYAHLSMLRRDKHHNKHLQNAFNKYGEPSFKFEVLEEAPPERLLVEEAQVIRETRVTEREIGYNKALTTLSPMKGRKHSLETIEKCRKASTGRKHSVETKRKISQAHKGKKISLETRNKMSDAKKGIAPKCAFSPPTKAGRRRISEFAKTRTGHKNSNSRLTAKQIIDMRKDFEIQELTNVAIAEKYKVSLSTIKRIKYGKTGY